MCGPFSHSSLQQPSRVCALSPAHSPSARQQFNTRERQSRLPTKQTEDQHLPGGLLSNLRDERAPRGDADAATDWSARTNPHCQEHLGGREGGRGERGRGGRGSHAHTHAHTHDLSHARTHARTHTHRHGTQTPSTRRNIPRNAKLLRASKSPKSLCYRAPTSAHLVLQGARLEGISVNRLAPLQGAVLCGVPIISSSRVSMAGPHKPCVTCSVARACNPVAIVAAARD